MESLRAVAKLIIVILLVVEESEGATISCNDVSKDLLPCVSYLVSGSGLPPSACCDGAKALSSAADATTADKKAACECIKSAAANVNYNATLARDLPTNCGITLPFTISTRIDCSTIS